MFCREALVWNWFSHPNLIPFLGVKDTPYGLALISEWMEHGTILQFVKDNPETNRLKLVCTLSISRTTYDNDFDTQLHDVASGLEYLHNFRFIHSDLKSVSIEPFLPPMH
jgi:serine/threonine protein kinase